MVTTSKDANPNYLAKIVRLRGVRKHSDADRLQCVDIDFQTVVTGLDAKDGDIYVYFPVESQINLDYLVATGSLRPKVAEQGEPEQTGFFERKGRVKALRLRGEKSMGYIVPVDSIKGFVGDFDHDDYINVDFDTINGILMVKKYEVVKKGGNLGKQGKQPKTNRLIDGQVRLHVDTENLRTNVYRLSAEDEISISYKEHGTSWWVGNLKVKKRLSLFERILKKLGVNVVDTEYDHVYGSRKVVKNKGLEDPKANDHFYGYDLWEDIKDRVKEHIPEGFTLYGEAVGFTKDGGYIQKGFDYGCEPGEMKIKVYRITVTNVEGFAIELSDAQIEQFCSKVGLEVVKNFHRGKAYWVMPEYDAHAADWTEKFLETLQELYNEKDCHMCVEKVPEEGIVLRVASLFAFHAFKLKSFRFLEFETKSLDAEAKEAEETEIVKDEE
jgi:hypothetical protein